ncbi:MAG: response regulator transcription factor [Actinomycetes bacterium]
MRVLAVEDDPQVAGLLHRGLEREGHAVDIAATAMDGAWFARETSYDAIILDVNLPDENGFTLCQRLRDAGVGAPILLLTGRRAVEDRVTGLDAGADDYLVKPFSLSELSARLRALTRRGQVVHQTVITAGEVSLDPAQRRAWRSGLPLDLTPREYALLELLARHGGAAVSREAIRGTLWDFAAEVSDNRLDVLVSSLRAKIRQRSGEDGIATVRGFGYRLAVD